MIKELGVASLLVSQLVAPMTVSQNLDDEAQTNSGEILYKYQAINGRLSQHVYTLKTIDNTKIPGYDMWDHKGDIDASGLPISEHMKQTAPAGPHWYDNDAEGAYGAWKMKITFMNELGDEDSIYLLHDDGKDYDRRDEDYSFLGLLPLDKNHIKNRKPTLFGQEIDLSFFKNRGNWSLHTGEQTIMTSHEDDSGEDNEWSNNIFGSIKVNGQIPFCRDGSQINSFGKDFIKFISSNLNSDTNTDRPYYKVNWLGSKLYNGTQSQLLTLPQFQANIMGKTKDGNSFVDINWEKYNMHWGIEIKNSEKMSEDTLKSLVNGVIIKIEKSISIESIDHLSVPPLIFKKDAMNYVDKGDVNFLSSWGTRDGSSGTYDTSIHYKYDRLLNDLSTLALDKSSGLVVDPKITLKGINDITQVEVVNPPISQTSLKVEGTMNSGITKTFTKDLEVPLSSGSSSGEEWQKGLFQGLSIGLLPLASAGLAVGAVGAIGDLAGAIGAEAVSSALAGFGGTLGELAGATFLTSALPAAFSGVFYAKQNTYKEYSEILADKNTRIDLNQNISADIDIDQIYHLYGSAKATSLFGDRSIEKLTDVNTLLDFDISGTKIVFKVIK